MEENNQTKKPELDEIINEVKSYVGVTAELYKLKATEKGAEVASIAIINIVLGIFASMILLFASIALALLFASLLGKMYLGFLMVAALYTVFSIILLVSKDRWLKGSLTDSIIRVIHAH